MLGYSLFKNFFFESLGCPTKGLGSLDQSGKHDINTLYYMERGNWTHDLNINHYTKISLVLGYSHSQINCHPTFQAKNKKFTQHDQKHKLVIKAEQHILYTTKDGYFNYNQANNHHTIYTLKGHLVLITI